MAKKISLSQGKSSKETTKPLLKKKINQVSQTFLIRNNLGLHARAAAQFVKIATHFTSEIFIKKDSHEINGKSIMGVLMLAASKGTKITVKASGPDAKEALEALGKLIENKFGED